MAQYSIREISALSGIKPHTIRIWEQRYGLIDPERTDTNIRYYTDEQLRFILNVSYLNNNGYKISSIAKMDDNELTEQVQRLTSSNFEFENQIQSFIIAMVELDEQKFEKIMASNIMQLGMENCMINVVFPFMDRIGHLWCTGAINPAHEHFITNLIRQKLIVAIDSIIPRPNDMSKTALLFLPEGDFHELGLLFTYYMLKKRNHKVVYLGASVPAEDLKIISEVQSPQLLFTILTLKNMKQSEKDYVNVLSKDFPKCEVLITGLLGKRIDESAWKNVKVLSTMDEAVTHFNDIS